MGSLGRDFFIVSQNAVVQTDPTASNPILGEGARMQGAICEDLLDQTQSVIAPPAPSE
jgi:hypothetical protein